MKYIVTKLGFFSLLLCLSATVGAQQKGVAINKPSLDPGLILDVSGLDGSTRLGVRLSPLSSAPQTTQEGSLYFDTGLKTYRQWTGSTWQNLYTPLSWTIIGDRLTYSGDVSVDGTFLVEGAASFGSAINVDGGITTNGPIISSGLTTDFINSEVRVTTAAVFTDGIRIGEDIPTDDALHLQLWGNSWFRNGASGTDRYAYFDNIAIKNTDGDWTEIVTRSNGIVSGMIIANSPSDIRLKQNILPISGAMSMLKQLNGIAYDWNKTAIDLFIENNGTNLVRGPEQSEVDFAEKLVVVEAAAKAKYAARETGLIAQEVQKVLPEAVVEAEDGFLRVKYGHLAGLFVEAIKEQQAIIDSQAERIRQLEAQQLGVLARLERLESSATTASGKAED